MTRADEDIQCADMMVFIQRPRDGLFLKTCDEWVKEERDARAFLNCTPAIEFCIEHGLHAVRLWLSFGETKYDFPLDVFRRETGRLVTYDKNMQEKRRTVYSQMCGDS